MSLSRNSLFDVRPTLPTYRRSASAEVQEDDIFRIGTHPPDVVEPYAGPAEDETSFFLRAHSGRSSSRAGWLSPALGHVGRRAFFPRRPTRPSFLVSPFFPETPRWYFSPPDSATIETFRWTSARPARATRSSPGGSSFRCRWPLSRATAAFSGNETRPSSGRVSASRIDPHRFSGRRADIFFSICRHGTLPGRGCDSRSRSRSLC